MPILVRYCLTALWPPFLLATGLWMFILNLLFYLRDFLDYLFKYQTGTINCFRLLLYIQPSFLVLAIPIGFLTAILYVYGRLGADREMMAVESCGLSVGIFLWPMLGISLLFSIFLVVFMDISLPWGNTSFLKLNYKILTQRSAVIVREKVFIKDFDGYVLYVGKKDDVHDLLYNVKVFEVDKDGNLGRETFAKSGTLCQDPTNYHIILKLNDGEMQQLGTGKKQSMAEFFQLGFKTCALDLNAHKVVNGPLGFQGPRNISARELAQMIEMDKKQKKDTRYYEMEFQKKFSIPFSALAFAFIGIPIGLMSRAGSLASPVLAVILVVVYWCFIVYGETGGPMGTISPFWAMWLPNFTLMGFGVLLTLYMNNRNLFNGNYFKTFNKAGNLKVNPNPPTTVSV